MFTCNKSDVLRRVCYVGSIHADADLSFRTCASCCFEIADVFQDFVVGLSAFQQPLAIQV